LGLKLNKCSYYLWHITIYNIDFIALSYKK
jgi:hypothetical protein